MSNFFKVDMSPGMGTYRHHQNYPYSVQTALAEFIDNSVQSYISNQNAISIIDKKTNNLKINISIKTGINEISIIDNAGGINREKFKKAIRLGANIKHPETSLSKFGLGMKTAATWFSSIWEIETSSLGSTDKLTSEFNLDELEEKGETKISVFVNKEKERNHYTKITIKNSKKIGSKKSYEETVIPHLTETFIKFKRFLSIIVVFDNEILKSKKNGKIKKAYFDPPEPLNYPILDRNRNPLNRTNKKWKRNIEINHGSQKVKGHFIIMEKGSYSQPGIRLFRNLRVIEGTIIKPNRPKTLFGTAVNKYAGFRLYGELHLKNFELDFMKTEFVGLGSLYSELKQELQKHPSFIDQLNRLRKPKDKDTVPEMEEEVSEEEAPNEIIVIPKNGQPTRKKKALHTNNTKIQKSEELNSKLFNLKKKKLHGLYNSLCKISLIEHPYLAYIGSWVFLECISRYMSNEKETAFNGFYKSKADKWYKDHRSKKKSLQGAIEDIFSKGNEIKHSHIRVFSDAKQLNNDFQTLEEFIIKCIDAIQDN